MAARPGLTPTGQPGNGWPMVSVAGVTLDLLQRRLAVPAAQEVVLTPLQAAILAHLMRRPGRVCTREELMCQALGYPVPVGSRTVDVHVASLRSKLGGALVIRSVRGVGYTLEPLSAS
jgi:DNA-binding response OmpR family regulator